MTTDNQNSPVAPQGEYPSLPEAAVWSVAGKDGMPTLGKGWMFSPVQQGNATLPLFTADQLRAYFDLGRQAAPALEAPSAPHRGAVNDLAQLLFDAWAKAEPEHGVTKHPMSYWASFCDMARAVLAAAPQAQTGAPDWWRKRADEIEAQVAATGSSEAMRCYTDMRTLLQSAAAPQAPAQEAPAAPVRQVLTDAQITHLQETRVGEPSPSRPIDASDWMNFARAIEAASLAALAKCDPAWQQGQRELLQYVARRACDSALPVDVVRATHAAMPDELADEIRMMADKAAPASCDRPPAGWTCTRAPGHDGPCAAAPAAPAVDAKAHDWRENASYGGEICAECGAAKGSRRGNAPCAWPPEPLDVCTDPYNCARCKTHPAHRGDMHHAGISRIGGSA